MSRNTKIILIIVCSVLLVCLLACGAGYIFFRNVGQNVMESAADTPEEAAAMGREIAEFTLPRGYKAQSGINLMGIKMVFYGQSKDTDRMIMLLEMPVNEELNDSSFEQMRTQMEQQSGRRMENVKTIQDRALTIRGKPGRVVIQEGTAGETKMRQMMVAFQGKSGLALLMVTGASKGWDQSAYNKMIKSIK